MSATQFDLGGSPRRWLFVLPCALLALATALVLLLIPVVYQDPDAWQGSSAIGFLIHAAISGSLALLAFFGRRNRGALIGVAVGALLLGLVFLDAIAAFSYHSRAPWVEVPLAWAVFFAEMLGGGAAIIGAIRRPNRARASPI